MTLRRTQTRGVLVAIIVLLLPCVFLIPGCSRSEPVWPDKPGKKILTTFTPIYCFTQAVAGDDANVMCLLTTTGPHSAHDTPTDVLKVRGADLVIGNGLELDNRLVNKLIGSSSKRNINTLFVGNVMEKKYHQLLDVDEDEPKGAEETDHHHGNHDPHIWLGPERAAKMVDIIADRLGELEPSKKEAFLERARKYKAKLEDLKSHGLKAFAGKTNKKIVTQHDSFTYFAAEFKLKIVGYVRLKEGEEGNPVKLIQTCKETQPAVITFEPQFDKKPVMTLRDSLKRNGVDVEIIEVDPIETAPALEGSPNPDPDYYLTKMRENIDNLARVLK